MKKSKLDAKKVIYESRQKINEEIQIKNYKPQNINELYDKEKYSYNN